MAAAKIPVVSLADLGDEQALAEQLTEIFHRIGFVVVVDHGVPDGLRQPTASSSGTTSAAAIPTTWLATIPT